MSSMFTGPVQTPVNTNYHGNQGLVLRAASDISVDKLGVWTGSATYSCPLGQEGQFAPNIYDPHPIYPIMLVERVRISQQDGWGWLYVDYAGAYLPGQDVWDLAISTCEEPIAVHPEFISTLAGTPSSPLHGAYFDPVTQKFVGFTNAPGSTDDSTNPLYGTETYLDAAQITWRHTYLSATQVADVSAVGYISTPDGAPPALGTGENGSARDWLLIGVTSERRGYVYTITKEWRASGKAGGWNPMIYGS